MGTHNRNQIQRMNQFLTWLIIVSSTLALVSFAWLNYTTKEQIISKERQITILKLKEDFLSNSKNLTMSVRAFVATGDEKFRQEYYQEVEKSRLRDETIHQVIETVLSAEEQSLLETAIKHSNELMETEIRAMDLAFAGNHKFALSLVYDENYEKSLLSIYEPTEVFLKSLELRIA